MTKTKIVIAITAALMGLQVTAQIAELPEYNTGPFTTTAVVTVRGDYVWQCFDTGMPYSGGTCWQATRPAGVPPCGLWQHTFRLSWCCIPCDWREQWGEGWHLHYSYWVGTYAGRVWSIGGWNATPVHQSNCPFDPVFWDQTRKAGAVPACRTPTPTPKPYSLERL
jgi:hypothetical protein